jgi:hypothetical protein
MITETIDAKELFASLDKTWKELLHLVSSTNESLINKVPFKDSWTVAQLAAHVTKSNRGMAKALQIPGKPAERDPAEGVGKMKKIFLDFSAKYQSPEFIIPEVLDYDKKSVVNDLENSIQQLKEERMKVNLSEMINVQVFGDVTKLELFHFVLYHTQRHIHQLKNILKEL